MRSAVALAAIVISIAVQTTLAGYIFRGSSTAIDLVLIVVVYIAIKSGPVTGLLAGTVAGLIQDALSSGVLGIGGLAKTIVGFLSGSLGTQFIVTAPLPRFLLLIVATALHAAIFIGLYTLLNLRQFPAPYPSIVGQPSRVMCTAPTDRSNGQHGGSAGGLGSAYEPESPSR